MKHNIILKALRWMAAAGLCLAAAACSKDDVASLETPQEGITPTRIIFNVSRGGYEGDAETRAPKSEWEEGDVVYFGVQGAVKNTATYTGGEWVVQMNSSIPDNPDFLYGIYAERSELNIYGHLAIEHGDVAFTSSGNYKVSEGGVATITLNLDQHPQGRMTFTGVGQGNELVIEGMKRVSLCNTNTTYLEFKDAAILLHGSIDGTATIYGLPTPTIVSGNDINLQVRYNGVWYKKTFANKVFKLYPDGTYEAETIEPLKGSDKRIIGIVIYAGRHATDNSDYTKALTEGGPAISGNVNGYAIAITNATGTRDSATADRPAWLIGPGGAGDYIYDLDSYVSADQYAWNGYANCQAIHNFVEDHAGEGFEMRHFQAAWVCETYGYRNLNYDGSVNGGDYTWQQLLKAPAGTSGWFLPSVGQLAYMRTNVNYLDERLEAVKGYSSGWPDYQDRIVPLSYKYIPYWSSTAVSGENNTALNRFITPDKPNVAIEGNRNDPYLPRPILVF